MQLTMERIGSEEGVAVSGGGRGSVGAADQRGVDVEEPPWRTDGRRGATMAQGQTSRSGHGSHSGGPGGSGGNDAGAVRGMFLRRRRRAKCRVG